MVEQPDITEMQIAAFTYGQKLGARISTQNSNPGSHIGPELKKPQKDQLLEETLADNIGISKLLTKREMQILQSILAGKTNKQIARSLSRSCRTVEYHRNRLMRKLNAHNAAELVVRAIAMGIA